jgi:hypothetical protein
MMLFLVKAVLIVVGLVLLSGGWIYAGIGGMLIEHKNTYAEGRRTVGGSLMATIAAAAALLAGGLL